VIKEVLTGVIARNRRTLTRAKWEEGKGKKLQYLINKWIIQNETKQNNTRGECHRPVLFHGKNIMCRTSTEQGVKDRDSIRVEGD